MVILHCGAKRNGDYSLGYFALVSKSVRRRIAGATAIVGESSLSVGLEFITIGWTQGH